MVGQVNKAQIEKEVIEKIDEDEYLLSINSEEDAIDVKTENRSIIWQPKDFSIREFKSMKEDGELILQPDYQRKFVMNQRQSSRLIESVLMNVPIPSVYLAEEQDSTYSVIDGQQRLTSFISYLEGKFPDGKHFKLSGLKVLKELNNKSFLELEKPLQGVIKKATIHSIVIKKESEEDIKFEIFERLNTGSIKLNEDEIRNTIYRGNYIKLLAELENDTTFHSLVRKDNYKKRMIYRGMILRFFTLSEKTYLNYKPSMKQFCNKELRDNRNMGVSKMKEFREKFKNTIELVRTVFGEQAFRRFIPGDEDNPNGKWATNRINMALFDIQMCCFANYNKNQIYLKVDTLKEALIDLMVNNDSFIHSIEIKTSDRDQMAKRFKIWYDTIDKILGSPNSEPRLFSSSTKKKLFDEDSTCKLCNQQILMIDDSEVDHIIPYSKGGKTKIENAQLTHRYCNRNKSNN